VIDYWPLLGIALVVIGFALRFNPLLVVALAAIVTGLLGHMPFAKVLGVLGHGFNENRTVTLIYIVLPVIGLLERFGLQQQARALIERMRGATTGRLLIVYMIFRQIFGALGLTSVAFGEDIFIAVSSILLIQGALKVYGIELTPFELSAWAIPSAVCALLIHGTRLLLLDRWLGRRSR
jgi:uncharacterized membrane protein